jgi:hypothetical protein
VTNKYAHSGINDDGARIFEQLLAMTRGSIPLCWAGALPFVGKQARAELARPNLPERKSPRWAGRLQSAEEKNYVLSLRALIGGQTRKPWSGMLCMVKKLQTTGLSPLDWKWKMPEVLACSYCLKNRLQAAATHDMRGGGIPGESSLDSSL